MFCLLEKAQNTTVKIPFPYLDIVAHILFKLLLELRFQWIFLTVTLNILKQYGLSN